MWIGFHKLWWVYSNWKNYIHLYASSNFGVASAASKILNHENTTCLHAAWPFLRFSTLFEFTKKRLRLLKRSVRFSACELQSETTSCNFGCCPSQNNAHLSGSLRHYITMLWCQIIQYIESILVLATKRCLIGFQLKHI